jgi:membrane-bound toxin of toxin-antitoxin system
MDSSENPFLATIRLPVKNSPIMLMAIITVHVICLLLPWLTGLALFIKLLLTCVALVSFCVHVYKFVQNSDNKCIETLILDSEDNWQVKIKNGAAHHAELGHSLFVHPYLTIISLSYEDQQKYFIFTPENIDADQFRRLRVRLRFRVGSSD